jgi:hypothetical protein
LCCDILFWRTTPEYQRYQSQRPQESAKAVLGCCFIQHSYNNTDSLSFLSSSELPPMLCKLLKIHVWLVFHGDNMGSNPIGDANKTNNLLLQSSSFLFCWRVL